VSTETDIQRRLRRYWFEDGLAELGIGGLFLVVGLAFIVGALASNSTARAAAVVALLAVVGIGTIASRFLIRAVKERVTYPRTGYVEYRRSGSRSRYVAAVGIIALISASAVAAQAGAVDRTLALQSLTLAAVLGVPAYRFGLFRFYALAGAAVAAGAIAWIAALDEEAGSALIYGGVGLALVGSGGWTLRGYLHRSRGPGVGVGER
jgi:hypothetical protein